jgi:hypothetical protein
MGNAPSEAGGYGFRIIQILKRENYLGILSPSSAGGITHAARRASSVIILKVNNCLLLFSLNSEE